ncbi:unnamed protein product [Rhizophagus irregularis]|nr:unnamed protein product [Rhizophagus irregularis]
MSRQTYLYSPKFNKKLIFNSPDNKYQEFTNAYAYSIMLRTGNNTPNRAIICKDAAKEWRNIKNKSTAEIDNIIKEYITTPINPYFIPTIRANCSNPRVEPTPPPIIDPIEPVLEVPKNASAQKKIADAIQIAKNKLAELNQIYNITTDFQIKNDIHSKIAEAESEISVNKDKISKLKRNAIYAQNCRAKKLKMLTENQEVVRYDHPGRPSLLFEYPDLHNQIHDSIEFGSADSKRRKQVVKVRIIEHLRKNLEENYNVYMARTTLNNYVLPKQSNSIAAKAHHHPAWVAVAGVSRTDTQEHIDGHYCLASVKYAKQFASMFADMSTIISQDDKAKIGLGVPAVGRTFCTLQSINEPVSVADHDFPTGSRQKLIPSVYLIMKPEESKDELRTGQLAIFVCPQWSVGTSSLTHMQDLESLTLDSKYDDMLKTSNGQIRPIWMLLVDGGPDENPRHLKNIKVYCQLFKKFDLDYLSVRTHAPGQSKYNPVERGMATLSGKLAGITLPIDHFGKHLNSQGDVTDPELAAQNFQHAGKALCDIWSRDLIFGKRVDAQYIDTIENPFEDLQFKSTEKEKDEELERQEKQKQKNAQNKDKDEADEITFSECFVPWSWIERHCNLCAYSIDIKRCKDTSCCGSPRAEAAMEFLETYNGFLPPVTEAKDGHFTNPIHILQYCDLLKIPGYDAHCPTFKEKHSRLCCSICNKYFPTITFLTKHKRTVHSTARRRSKGRFNKQTTQKSRAFDDFSLLQPQPSKRLIPYVEIPLRSYLSDGE